MESPSHEPAGLADNPELSQTESIDGHESDAAGRTRDVAAPRVEVVLVAHDPEAWFEETLYALASQDYVRLAVTILAAGDSDRIAERVHLILPDANVTPVASEFGYGRCANTVLDREATDPAFFLFCHDDVAPNPDAVRLLVEEAVRSNAAVVGPKLVAWHKPEVLAEVGLDVDKLAHVSPRIEPGEIDQEQHDHVTDVFAVGGAMQLVRADLFRALGGYDATMGVTGEDIDLCWRTHVAGARVLIAPSSVVRHRAGIVERRGNIEVERLRERHRVRTVLTVYGPMHSLRVVPQALVYSMLRALGALITGQLDRSRAAAGAWVWNLRHPTSLAQRRSSLARIRRVPDHDIRQLQVAGFAPVSQFMRGQFGTDAEGGGTIGLRSRNLLRSLRSGPSMVSLAFWVLTAAMLVFGSRHLITRRVPEIGSLVPFDVGPSRLFERFFDSWQVTGNGHDAASPTAYALVGSLGFVFAGAMGLLRTVLTVGMIPIGAIGMWRFMRPFASPWSRVVGAMIYLAVPVPYNALAAGNWVAVVLYGLMPWVVASLGRAGRLAPFGPVGGPVGDGVLAPSVNREVLGFGLLIALPMALMPAVPLLVAVCAASILVGSWLSGHRTGWSRLVGITAASMITAVALHLPWLVGLSNGAWTWDWATGTGGDVGPATSVADLLRLDSGGIGGGALGWSLPFAAAVPLLLARGPRWAWAVRGLTMYLAAVALLWADGRGWIPGVLPRIEVVLVVGALGVAIAAAMGVAAVERDLRTYRLGWRQLVPVSAAIAMALAIVPVTVASFDGDWQMPSDDYNRQFATEPTEGRGRVLWIGHDDVVAAQGARYGEELTAAVTRHLVTGFLDGWAGPAPADDLVAEALELAMSGGTSRLGHLLAPFSISEIILLEQAAPSPATGIRAAIPPELHAAMSEQLDLAELDTAPGMTRFRNTSWIAPASVVEAGSTGSTTLRSYASAVDTAPTVGLLAPDDEWPTRFVGEVGVDDEVYLSAPRSSSWRMIVDGRVATRGPALDWAQAFRPTTSGVAVLEHRTSTSHHVMMAAQAILWLLAVAALIRLNATSTEARP